MDDAHDPLLRLQDLQHFLAGGTLEESLNQQAAMTAALLGADSCSIMLLGSPEADGDDTNVRMSMYARYGQLPDAALKASVGCGEGIAGGVLASGLALLVPDIGKSKLAPLAQGREQAGASLMCVPIRIDGKIVGVINVASGAAHPPFGDTELRLLEVTALFIGKSIQVQQLQHLLDSRFAQLALQHEGTATAPVAYQNPEVIARMLARSFFKEMVKAGFGSPQIVSATTEIIEQLNNKLHSDAVADHKLDK